MHSAITVQQNFFTQGLDAVARARQEAFCAAGDRYWDQAASFAASQPLVTAMDEAALSGMLAAIDDLKSRARTLVVIGTGGASLGAQALCVLAPNPDCVRFLDHCDAASTARLFASINPQDTAWLLVSKSGETVETLATTLAIMAHYETLGLSLADRVRVITSPGARPLRTLAQQQEWSICDHPANLGGRFSVFSGVGLFPAAFAGIDVGHLLQQVRQHWQHLWHTQDAMLLQAASLFAASLPERPMHVVMAYGDQCAAYTRWYKQLWAESLGKNGIGPTPVTAIGSLDQHSQLQLYLGGPRDKCFTLLLPHGELADVKLAHSDIEGVAYLSFHQLQDVMEASGDATYQTLAAHQLPVRLLRLPFTAEAIGPLMARTMIETLLTAAMLEVDPFDQPAVEEGKIRARRALGMAQHA